MNALTTIDTAGATALPEHIDLTAMATMLGIPHRAITRWTKGSDPIPFVGHRSLVMFPKAAALAWVARKYPDLYRIRNLGGEDQVS